MPYGHKHHMEKGKLVCGCEYEKCAVCHREGNLVPQDDCDHYTCPECVTLHQC